MEDAELAARLARLRAELAPTATATTAVTDDALEEVSERGTRRWR